LSGARVRQRLQAVGRIYGPPPGDVFAADAENVGNRGIGETQLAGAQLQGFQDFFGQLACIR
jgi:hypothetical protein